MAGDQVGDDLGVGVAVEDDALFLQLALEGGVVLDDAVVDDGDAAIAAEVRMGVAVGGRAVGGPARVADADAAGRRLLLQMSGQFGDAAGPLADVQMRAGQRGHAGAVVAAIFQPPQALDKDRFRLSIAHVTDDAAHKAIPLFRDGHHNACSALQGRGRKRRKRIDF